MASLVARANEDNQSLILKGVDPETCMIVFKNHWAQVLKILEKHDPLRSSGGFGAGGGGLRFGPIPGDEASEVQNYVEHMLLLLMEEESGQVGSMGPILEFVVTENVMEKLFLWSLRREFTDDMKIEQLKMYEMLVVQSRQPLLHHKPVLKPLMMLLSSCSGTATPAVEAALVILLNQLCSILAKDSSILELFFHTSEDQGAANFLIFSLLIPFIHCEGIVGQQARDALLLIMSLSAENQVVAKHIAENTYFCPVAHPTIRTQLVNYIYNGFLVPVLAPALHKLTLEEVMTTTAYLELFLHSVTEPALLQTFLSFILLHQHENVHILDTLVSRINTPFQLGTVSLSLFKTLIGLHCEDVMLQLILSFLQFSVQLSFLDPYIGSKEEQYELDSQEYAHIVGCQKGIDVSYLHYLYDARNNITRCIKACRVWSAPYDGENPPPEQLQLVPAEEGGKQAASSQRARLSRVSSGLTSTGEKTQQLELEWDDSYDTGMSPGGDGDLSEGDTGVKEPMPIEPPRHIQEMRKNAIMLIKGSYIEESDFQDDVMVYNLIAQRDAQDAMEHISSKEEQYELDSQEYAHIVGCQKGIDVSYLHYLYDARNNITRCIKACRVWSAPYDGENPPPEQLQLVPAEEGGKQAASSQRARLSRVSSGLTSTGEKTQQLELEWDDSYDTGMSPGGDGDLSEGDTGVKEPMPVEPPRHIQEMRKNAIMLIKGSYIEESDFQDDVMVYNLIAQRDAQDAMEHISSSPNGSEKTAPTVLKQQSQPLCNGLTATQNPKAVQEQNKKNVSLSREGHPVSSNGKLDDDSKLSEPDHNSNLRIPSMDRDDLISQYDDLLKDLGANSGGPVEDERAFVDPVTPTEEDDVDFNAFSDDMLDPERLPSPFGLKSRAVYSVSTSTRIHGAPFTGPFVSVLLSRLENMLENSLHVNLLLTEIIAQLAAYPQPLLCSFLLNTNMVFQPSVRSLYQVLAAVKNQIEQIAATKKDIPALVTEAQQYFLSRDVSKEASMLGTHKRNYMLCIPQVLAAVKNQIEQIAATKKDIPVLVTEAQQYFLSRDVSKDVVQDPLHAENGQWVQDGGANRAQLLPSNRLKKAPPLPKIPSQMRNVVFATVLYTEFLKELAAVAQEHTIVSYISTEK
ncbi:UNVERIFIED_CONTAM: hypothetical protein FKN15_008483 [Acipenser sinensis]